MVGCVYLIHQVGTDKYKIGTSRDPERRIFDLQTGNPVPLDLAYFTPHCAAEYKEKWLQKRWDRYSTKETTGEWFEFEPGVLLHVIVDYFSLAIEYADYQISLKTTQMQEWLDVRELLFSYQQKIQLKSAQYVEEMASIQARTNALNAAWLESFRDLFSPF